MSDYSKLFKAYDVRGTVPDINESIYYWTAVGLVETILKPEGLPLEVNLFRDGRYSSPEFYKAFYNGLIDSGAKPLAMGLGSTDFMYAACQVGLNPGTMITASHNPKDDNGIKIVKQAPQMLGLQSGLDKVRDFVLTKMELGEVDKVNWIEPEENLELKEKVWDFYLSKIKEIGKPNEVDAILKKEGRKLKVVVDCGNGMGGFLMEKIKHLYSEIDFIPLFWDIDGNFPNHPADPSHIENMLDCGNKIVELKADLGVCFDGDADRAYSLDENGKPMTDNYVVAALAKAILQEYKAKPLPEFNPSIVYSQPQSRCVPYTVLEEGGIPVPSKQGHTYVKADMKRYKAIYGGEGTGHHYFGQFGYMDTGSMVFTKVIHLIVSKNILPSQLIKEFANKYHLSGEINFKVTPGLSFEEIKTKLLSEYLDASVSTMDGLSLFYPTWKINIRASNTEPVIRLNFETIGDENIADKISEVRSVIGLN